jgi:hypothetical protein
MSWGKAGNRPGRPQKCLDPSDPLFPLAQALRDLREASGEPPYRKLAKYAGIPSQTLSDAARGEHLPAWKTVEGYVRGCHAYCQPNHQVQLPVDCEDDVARLRQLYRKSGGDPPGLEQGEEKIAKPNAESAPDVGARGAEQPLLAHLSPGLRLSSGFPRRHLLTGAGAIAVVLAAGASFLVGASLGSGHRPRTDVAAHPTVPATANADILVTSPAPVCGNAASDGFRSPATIPLGGIANVHTLSLDGFSVSTMKGLYGGDYYYWAEAHPTGRRAGIQLRWSSGRNEWHYCTATLEAGNISRMPDLVTTMAIPAVIRGRHVITQVCIWHKDPFTERCTSIHS